MKLLKRLKAWWIWRKKRGRYSPMYGCYVNTPEYWERRAAKQYEIIALLDEREAERKRRQAVLEEKLKQRMEKREQKKRKAHRE